MFSNPWIALLLGIILGATVLRGVVDSLRARVTGG